MARKPKLITKKKLVQYEHKGRKRLNNPPVGLVNPQTDQDAPKKKYKYDPHLDPQLIWAGKAEHALFQVPTVSLHVHERIDARTIIDAVKKKNGAKDIDFTRVLRYKGINNLGGMFEGGTAT